MKYEIKEKNGKFIIYVLAWEAKSMIGSNKILNWFPCSKDGTPYWYGKPISELLPGFDTFKQAEQKLNIIKNAFKNDND